MSRDEAVLYGVRECLDGGWSAQITVNDGYADGSATFDFRNVIHASILMEILKEQGADVELNPTHFHSRVTVR